MNTFKQYFETVETKDSEKFPYAILAPDYKGDNHNNLYTRVKDDKYVFTHINKNGEWVTVTYNEKENPNTWISYRIVSRKEAGDTVDAIEMTKEEFAEWAMLNLL